MSLKRNDVVYRKMDDGFRTYGRVSRIFSDGRIEVLDCGKIISVGLPEQFVKIDYNGFWDSWAGREDNPLWRPMPSLRKLKRMCARYDKTVWKKFRNGLYCEETAFI